jgi:hypothetical protein
MHHYNGQSTVLKVNFRGEYQQKNSGNSRIIFLIVPQKIFL